MKTSGRENWTTVIKPRSSFLNINIKELLHYWDLVILFAKRDIATVYKQTILGPLWFVIQPVITTLIYTVIFGNLAKLSTDGIPRALFYFSGTMLWGYFHAVLISSADTFINNANLFGKVYFPRLAVPLSKIWSHLVALIIHAATLTVLYGYFLFQGTTARPTWGLLLFPVIVLWLAVLGAGLGLVISALTTKYRDLRQLVSFGVILWMYATPVVYPISQIPRKLQFLMLLNPVSAPIELFRSVAFGVQIPNPVLLLCSAGATVLAVFLGLWFFHLSESTFIDVV